MHWGKGEPLNWMWRFWNDKKFWCGFPSRDLRANLGGCKMGSWFWRPLNTGGRVGVCEEQCLLSLEKGKHLVGILARASVMKLSWVVLEYFHPQRREPCWHPWRWGEGLPKAGFQQHLISNHSVEVSIGWAKSFLALGPSEPFQGTIWGHHDLFCCCLTSLIRQPSTSLPSYSW